MQPFDIVDYKKVPFYVYNMHMSLIDDQMVYHIRNKIHPLVTSPKEESVLTLPQFLDRDDDDDAVLLLLLFNRKVMYIYCVVLILVLNNICCDFRHDHGLLIIIQSTSLVWKDLFIFIFIVFFSFPKFNSGSFHSKHIHIFKILITSKPTH